MGFSPAGRGARGLATPASIGLLAILLAVLAVSGQAAASGETRRLYAAKVEPICKAGTPPVEHLLSGTRRMANHGQPIAAGRRFVHASNVFAGTLRKVAGVHRPASDSARLGKWLDRLRNVKEGLRRIGTALKQRNRLKALNRVGQLRDAGTAANKVVRGFHFRYCRIYESRFS